MKSKNGSLIALVVLFVLFMILLVVSFISGMLDLGLLSAVALLSGFLAFIDYLGSHPSDRQNLFTGISFYLLAVAEFFIFVNDKTSNKSRIGWVAFGLFFGTYQIIKYLQIKSRD